jgi:hypothetical protein
LEAPWCLHACWPPLSCRKLHIRQAHHDFTANNTALLKI